MRNLERIYIDRSVALEAATRKILSRIAAPVSVIDDVETLYRRLRASRDPIRSGKHVLHLTSNRGGFIRKCPGTRNYTCCDYMILHIGTYCTMDCAYCILQSYFHPPVLLSAFGEIGAVRICVWRHRLFFAESRSSNRSRRNLAFLRKPVFN